MVTVDLYEPNSTISSVDLPTPAYEIGTRLLVSRRTALDDDAPLDPRIAWPPYGFTGTSTQKPPQRVAVTV